MVREHSDYAVREFQEAARRVAGLHHEMATGPTTKTLYMGWDEAAVQKAVEGHAAKEIGEIQAAKLKREKERAKRHADYCSGARNGPSPSGKYIVDCEKLEWEQPGADLSLDIQATDEPGIFKATFNFEVAEGMMLIGADKTVLEEHCAQLDRICDEEDAWYEAHDEWDGESPEKESAMPERPETGSKRKMLDLPLRVGGASKISKNTPVRKYFFKSRETSKIVEIADNGTITFTDGEFASFVGEADMKHVIDGVVRVVFTARETSDTTTVLRGVEWGDYSERHLEWVRLRRQH